jgi:hypothetical protein
MTETDVCDNCPSEMFKLCNKCKTQWKSRDDFLNDSNIGMIGLMANNDNYKRGAYLFNHRLPNDSCNTTIGLFVDNFLDMYSGEICEQLKMGTDECSGHCVDINELENCSAHCRNAIARKIMQEILNKLPSHKKL